MVKKAIVPIVAVTLALGACDGSGQKQTVGTILGGVGGAILGSQVGSGSGQIIAVAIGTLAGTMLGSEIGKSLDKADQAAMANAEQQAHTAPVGQTIAWNNPDSGNSGTVTPVRDGRNTQTGAYCREYQTTVTVGGRQEEAYGTACQQTDGSWKIVNS
jgi:surface antigen